MSSLVKSKLLCISNHTRDYGTSCDFTVNLQNEAAVVGATAVSVKSIYFENLLTNINTHNDTFLIHIDGAVRTVKLPHEQVDGAEFAALIEAAIFSQTGYGVTVTLSNNVLMFNAVETIGLISEEDGNTTADAAGITVTTTPIAGTVSGQEIVNLFGPGEVLIYSPQLASGNMTLNRLPIARTVDCLDTMCLSNTPYGYAYCTRSQDLNIDAVAYTKPRDIRSISIKLATPESDIALSMPSNFKFVITLKLFYEQ